MTRRSVLRFAWAALIALPCSFSSVAHGGTPAPELFQRVAIIGASVSAGFCTDEFVGGRRTPEFRLANYFNEALTCDHEPVVSRASKMLFLDARRSLEKQVGETLEAKPTLVVALDSLFWFCYGKDLTSPQRLELFEFGLKQLDRIPTPIIVGDLPDARHAAGGILSIAEVPEAEVLVKCNERLKAWASEKKNVTLFPFAAMMKAAVSSQPFTLGGRTWEAGKTRMLLQRDLLHPSHLGLATIAVATLDSASATVQPPVPQTFYRRDLESLTRDAVMAGVKQSQEASARAKSSSPAPPVPQPAK
jgi:hypothetical protein